MSAQLATIDTAAAVRTFPAALAVRPQRAWMLEPVAARPRIEADPLDQIGHVAQVNPDQAVFRQGEAANAVFRLIDGTLRIYKLLPDGRRQIIGFLQAGDLFGLCFDDAYLYTAEAVTVASVRRIPRAQLEQLMEQHDGLRRRLLAVTANELTAAQDQMLLLGRKNAQEKLCSFLASLSRRRAAQHKDPQRLHVPMSRADMADYLGLTVETVSRTLTKLKRAGVIRLLNGNKIELLDGDLVAQLAEGA